MSKSFVEKVKKGTAKLADKVEQKVEQFVDAVPTDDEIIDKLRDGLKKVNSKVAQVSPETAKTLRKIEGKIGVKPSPQNLAEIVDDLHNLKDRIIILPRQILDFFRNSTSAGDLDNDAVLESVTELEYAAVRSEASPSNPLRTSEFRKSNYLLSKFYKNR